MAGLPRHQPSLWTPPPPVPARASRGCTTGPHLAAAGLGGVGSCPARGPGRRLPDGRQGYHRDFDGQAPTSVGATCDEACGPFALPMSDAIDPQGPPGGFAPCPTPQGARIPRGRPGWRASVRPARTLLYRPHGRVRACVASPVPADAMRGRDVETHASGPQCGPASMTVLQALIAVVMTTNWHAGYGGPPRLPPGSAAAFRAAVRPPRECW